MWLVNYSSHDSPWATILSHCLDQLTCINTYNSHSNLGGRYYYYHYFASESARGRRQDKMSTVHKVFIRSQISGRSMFHAKKLTFILQSVRYCRFFRSVMLRVAFYCQLPVYSGSYVSGRVELDKTGERGGNREGKEPVRRQYSRSSRAERGHGPCRRALERAVWSKCVNGIGDWLGMG